jgi:hypothetical protein
MVIKESGLGSEPDKPVRVFTHSLAGLKELGFLHMRAVHLVEFPPMAVSVQQPHIFYRGVHIAHVLQTPYPATHYLREIKGLRDEGGVA